MKNRPVSPAGSRSPGCQL